MQFVPAICTNCGATLKVDSERDAWICQYCETPFVVEKAVNLYNSTYNIHGDVINIFGGDHKDFLIRGGILEKYNGEATDVSIPNNVTCIGEKAFESLRITRVSIPEGIELIDNAAFINCTKLQDILLPNSLKTIGNNCFSGCTMLKEIQLPEKLEEIGEGCFFNCTSLLEISIPDNVEILRSNVFFGCSNLKKVNLPSRLKSIEDAAFGDCVALESITIPASVKYIARYDYDDNHVYTSAFKGCNNLRTVTLPFDPIRVFYPPKNEDSDWKNFRMVQAFKETPWGKETKNTVQKNMEKVRSTHKCPLCGGKINFWSRCKNCGWEMSQRSL